MRRIEEVLRQRLAARAPKPTRKRMLRPAAVLILLVSEPDGYKVLLTRRANNLRRQPGDIAFPGGTIDAKDPSPLAAALRESEEEVGLDASDVDVLGQLDELPTVTGFRITPFVGAVKGPYAFRGNHEVGELILVPLASLRNPGAFRIEHRYRAGRRITVYHYRFQSHDIWGITGRLVKEILDLIPEELGPP